MAKPTSQTVVAHLRATGPTLSSVIAKRMESPTVSPDAARQRISRAVSRQQVRRLFDLRLPHNEAFLFLDDQFGTEGYWGALVRALQTTESAYGAAVQSLCARGGAVPAARFDCISGSPMRLKGHLSGSSILRGLQAVRLVTNAAMPGVGEVVQLHPNAQFDLEPTAKRMLACATAEGIILAGLRDWTRKLGLASFEKVRVRGDATPPVFGQFQWDLTAPSYIKPLVSHQAGAKPSPGFFVADAVIGQTLSAHHVRYFTRKCSIMRAVPNTRPFLAMIIADWFEKDAFDLLRREGVLATTPDNLFGSDVARGIAQLVVALTNTAEVAAKDPQVIADLFNSLSKIEGAANNLRGPLFEMIVGHCVREKEGNTIDIGKTVRAPLSGAEAEIDVFRVKEKQEVACYECKGHGPNVQVTLEEVVRWLEKSIPTIRDHLRGQERFQNSDQIFEYWTTGHFHPDAVSKLQEAKKKTKKYAINWRDGSDVLRYVRGIKATYLTKVLNEHYLKHPLQNTLSGRKAGTRSLSGSGDQEQVGTSGDNTGLAPTTTMASED